LFLFAFPEFGYPGVDKAGDPIMKPLIIYQSKTGNTRVIADTIASTLNADVLFIENVTTDDLKDRDLVGFGSGIYWTKIDKRIYDFTSFLSQECNVFIFITSGFGFPLMLNLYWYMIQRKIDRPGLNLIGKWDCRGYDKHPLSKWMGISKEHPNNDDIEKAQQFAIKMKKHL
jgi:flavodoxin